jgi:hypothetical protein
VAEPGVPISEAAKAFGISVDSLRKRVQRRSVQAYKGADGQWRVVLPGGIKDETILDADGPSETVDGTAQAVTDAQRRAGGIEAVQEILAPFIAELGDVREELGREKERRASAERERDQLRLEVARLRSVQRREPPPAPDAPEPSQTQREDTLPESGENTPLRVTERESGLSAGWRGWLSRVRRRE